MTSIEEHLTSIFGSPTGESSSIRQWGNQKMGMWFTETERSRWHFHGRAQNGVLSISHFMTPREVSTVLDVMGDELRRIRMNQ